MNTYTITAKRITLYELEIRAESEEQAAEELSRIEREEDVENYANDWYPLEIIDIEEIEDAD